MSDTIISLKGIDKSYGKHKVLTDVNLEVKKGDLFGLVGRNGAGKTTLFKVILGLSSYQKGSIELFGSTDLSKQRQRIGFLIGSNCFDYMTGRENLEYFRRLKGIKDKNEVDRVLKIVGLDGVKTKVGKYSLGMRQRLGIANAMMGNPELMILDEPTNGLDPQGIADVRNLVKRLNQEFGMTVIVSSHILGELQHTADRFGIVNNGTLAKVITQQDLLSSEKSVRIHVEDLDRAREVLENAGIPILNAVQETRSLEDFYFDMVGGEKE